jgi:hypothetical protein
MSVSRPHRAAFVAKHDASLIAGRGTAPGRIAMERRR